MQGETMQHKHKNRDTKKRVSMTMKCRNHKILSCQQRVTATSCFVYNRYQCFNRQIHNQYTSDLSIRVSSSGVYKLIYHLTIVNKT